MIIINKRTSKDKQIMKLVRPFVLLTMLNDIQFKADALFRFQMDRFRLLAPHAEKQPVPITTEFWKIILNM